MGGKKKKRLREKKKAAERKSGLLGLAKNALTSNGTMLAVAGLALGPVAAVLPWSWTLTAVVEVASYVLPAVGVLKACKDVAVPLINEAKEDAEDEALNAKILLLTDGKGFGDSTIKLDENASAEICYAIYPEDVVDEEDSEED